MNRNRESLLKRLVDRKMASSPRSGARRGPLHRTVPVCVPRRANAAGAESVHAAIDQGKPLTNRNREPNSIGTENRHESQS